MCGVTEAMVGMAIASMASTAMTVIGQNKQADAQEEAATAAAQADYAALADRQYQQNVEAQQATFERERQAEREAANIRVATGESGLAGLLPLRQLHDSMFQAEYDQNIIEYNRESGINQTKRDMASVRANAQGRINEANARKVGALAAGLQIGMSGADGAVRGYALGSGIKKWREGT